MTDDEEGVETETRALVPFITARFMTFDDKDDLTAVELLRNCRLVRL